VRIFIWTVSIILGLIVAFLAFVFVSPNYDLYIVRSGSMEPAINVGDMVLAGPVGTGGIKPGVIISYESGKNLITHRVLSIDGNTLITKGDANKKPDSIPVRLSQVQSRYIFRIPYVGYVAGFLRTRPGWLLSVVLPSIVLVGFIVKDIIKEASRNEKSEKIVVKK
jgi:signal peptidase I